MALRQQILSSPETLSDLAWAAEQRFADAQNLLDGARFTGAVCFLGLSVEIWLKLACFRFLGATLASPVHAQLGPARAWMRVHAPMTGHESYHSLLFWTEYLIRRRLASARPLSTNLTGELRHHVANRLFADWLIDLRYRFASVSEGLATRVYNDALWVHHSWPSLWR